MNPRTTAAGAQACHQLPLSAPLSRSPFPRAWLPQASVARTRGPRRLQRRVCLRCAALGLYVHVTRAPPQHPALTILPPGEHPPPTACLPHNRRSAPWNLPTPACRCVSDAVGGSHVGPTWRSACPGSTGHAPTTACTVQTSQGAGCWPGPHGVVSPGQHSGQRTGSSAVAAAAPTHHSWAHSWGFRMPEAGAEGPGGQSPE